MTTRRGFTLIELLVAMVLFLIVISSIYGLLNNTQRVSRAQAERVDMQSNMRAGALLVPSDLRAIGFDSTPGVATITSDILSMAADSIAFRAVRASGIMCKYTAANQIIIDTTSSRYYSAYRLPVAGRDSVMLFQEGDPTTPNDDQWISSLRISSVGTSTCSATYGSRPALVLNTTLAFNTALYGEGAPFRTYEVMVYKLYQSGGRNYLGAYSKSNGETAPQPVIGPLATNGFRLDYYDATGTTTTSVPTNVRLVKVTLIGQSDKRVTGGGAGSQALANDSVVTMVTLRNTLR